MRALLVVDRMPFFALHEETLQMLNLLLGYYADGLSASALAAPLRARFADCPLDFAFEMAGSARALELAYRVTRRGGTVVGREFFDPNGADIPAQAGLTLHQAEQWRDKLIADDDALTRWLEQDPAADVQHLRALIRQARKDAQAVTERPGEALRHGKAYREIFQIVRTALTPADESADGADDTQED